MTTYNYYKRQVTKMGGKVMTEKEWSRYKLEEITKYETLGKDYNLTSLNQRMIGISSGLIDEEQYVGQMRARARQMYMDGKLNVNPDLLSDAQLMKNAQVQNDRQELKENYEKLKNVFDEAVVKGQSSFVYNGEVYLVANGLSKAFSQAFFGSV